MFILGADTILTVNTIQGVVGIGRNNNGISKYGAYLYNTNPIHVQGPLSGLSSDYAETNALQLPLSESTCMVVFPIKEWGRFNMAFWS